MYENHGKKINGKQFVSPTHPPMSHLKTQYLME
jgi:hypothetical protein